MEIQTAHRILDAISDAIVEHIDEAYSAKVTVNLRTGSWTTLVLTAFAFDEDDELLLCEQIDFDAPELELAHFGQFIDEIKTYNVYDAEITDDLVDRLRMAISDAYEEAR